MLDNKKGKRKKKIQGKKKKERKIIIIETRHRGKPEPHDFLDVKGTFKSI